MINSNGDDREWTWSNGVAQYQYSMKNSADDWLLTPPIKLTKGSKYVFSYKAMSKDSKYPEKMEVLYGEGTTLENLKDTLLKETILPSAWTKYKNEIIIEKDGIYTFAFHAVSDAYMDCLYLTDINVDVYPLKHQEHQQD